MITITTNYHNYTGSLNLSVSWTLTPYNPGQVHWRYGGKYCIHFQGRRLSRAVYRQEASCRHGSCGEVRITFGEYNLIGIIATWNGGKNRPLICINVEVNSSLWLIKHHDMKTYEGMEVTLLEFLNSSVGGNVSFTFQPQPAIQPPVSIW
jgi:hypothetical protein